MPATLAEAPMTAETEPKTYTPEDLLTMNGDQPYELLDGKLVERDMGAEASEVAAKAIRLLGNHVDAGKRGKCFATDCGYQIFPDRPKRVRYPDGSFIARGRLPNEKTPKGHVRIAPDLALEVVSRNDTAEEIEEKRIDFLAAGTKVLWIIYPESRTVHVYRQQGPPQILTADQELRDDEVLGGFACRVAELFDEG